MAIIERPVPAVVAPAGPPVTPSTSLGVFRRPVSATGWRAWVFTVDHKKLGIMYGVSAMAFFVVGGIEALLIRAQLAGPDGKVLTADLYNQMFTMHATSMVFLFAMPMAAAFGNYFLPLQVGARDVAFPRINAFGFWSFLFGALFVNTSWILGGAADGGWFMYAPNSSVAFSPTHGIDIWALGLLITGVASQTGAINLIVTALNMRTKGMSLMRMPVFTWMILVIQFLLLFAIPVITVALVLLIFQREFDATFFSVAAGADPLLWQHLFWIFGHPEVYILVLPSFGIVSEVLPVFSKKPLFGYPFVVFSGAAIGFVGWGVWAHHMFASGLGPVSVAVFAVATMAIAIPTGVKIVNWTLTMWGGKLTFTTAMLFAIGLVVEFTIGGLSGVTHAVAPSDTQQTDTYYIVAHFHYVLFGGAVLGFFAGFYYWWPKVFGKCLNEKLGKWNFWLMIIGMNMTFGPMHIIGLQGQPRRMYVWTRGPHRRGLLQHRVLEPRRLDRRVHHRHRRAALPHQRRAHPPQGTRGAARPVGRPHARVDDDEAAEGAQLRQPADGARARRVLPPQVRGRRRGRQPRPAAGGHGRGDPRRAGGQRRPPHPPAVAVVLADRARLLAAVHRLRRDLQPVHRRRRGRASSSWRCSAGRWSRRSPPTPSTTPCRRRRRTRAPRWRPRAVVSHA